MTILCNLCASKFCSWTCHQNHQHSIHTNHRKLAFWPQFIGPQQKHVKEGKTSKKQVVIKPAITNPVVPQGLSFISWWVVVYYRLRYVNRWIISKTKCIKCPFVGLLFYHIKTLLAWILLRCASVGFYLDVVWHWRFSANCQTCGICEKLNAAKPCNNLQTFKTIYKISESFLAWIPTIHSKVLCNRKCAADFKTWLCQTEGTDWLFIISPW